MLRFDTELTFINQAWKLFHQISFDGGSFHRDEIDTF